MKNMNGCVTVILLLVDNILTAHNIHTDGDWCLVEIKQIFEVKKQSKRCVFLGISIGDSGSRIKLDQEAMIKDILKLHSMESCTVVSV